MKEKVYLETSVFSFLASKPSRDILSAAWQAISHEWWGTRRHFFDLYISELVKDESSRGDASAALKRNELLEGLPLLAITDEAVRLSKNLVAPGLLPIKMPSTMHCIWLSRAFMQWIFY